MTAARTPGTFDDPDGAWMAKARCRDTDPETLFVKGAAQHQAKMICNACEVRMECLAEALDSGGQFGVWGGLTERERRMLVRRLPDVTSWRKFLQSVTTQ
jgi:WhiB family transcriptional regulator, redox-sensing transcriptional regulator